MQPFVPLPDHREPGAQPAQGHGGATSLIPPERASTAPQGRLRPRPVEGTQQVLRDAYLPRAAPLQLFPVVEKARSAARGVLTRSPRPPGSLYLPAP